MPTSIWPSRFARGRIRRNSRTGLPMRVGQRCGGATSPAASSRCTRRRNQCAEQRHRVRRQAYRAPMLYGRVADPDATIGTDTRADPRMVAAFVPFGLDGRFPAPELEVDAPLEDRLAFAAMAEDGTGAILDAFAQAVPGPQGVVTTTTTITGVDGNDVTLYISRPDAADAALP